jgi:PAS domain S-box-containing protein
MDDGIPQASPLGYELDSDCGDGCSDDAVAQMNASEDPLTGDLRYRLTVDLSPALHWITDHAGRIVSVPDRACALLGLPRGQILGAEWLDFIHPDDRQRALDSRNQAALTGSGYDIEYRLRVADGSHHWMRVRAMPRLGASGGVSCWYGSTEDIQDGKENAQALRDLAATLDCRVAERTQALALANARLEAEIIERQREELLARESEHRIRVLLEGVVDYAIFMLDPSGLIANWSSGAVRIKGYSEQEVVGTHFSRFYTAEDREADEPARALAAAAEEGRYEKECWRVRKDGTRFWASIVLDSIREPDGTLIGFAKVTRDITNQREAQQALEEAREQLFQVQKLEAVGQLTGGIAHDFNNLLQGITGSLEVAQWRIAKRRFEDLDSLISGAISSATRAAALTHRLLAFARRQPLDPKPVQANRRLAAMKDIVRSTMGEMITPEFKLAEELWPTLCDPNQLDGAILNLLVNAREAMPDGGRLMISTVNTAIGAGDVARNCDMKPGQYVCICVSDTGIGMPRHILDRAFDPFFTTKPAGQGTGLGLSMIYGFARQSEGYCRIDSEVGKGTTVKLYLPRHGKEEAVLVLPAPVGAKVATAADSGEVVLVVEDEQLVRTLVVEVLSDLGYRALEAGDGQAGLAILQSPQRIDLLVTDIGLPGLNGRQMADAARKTRQDLKILFMTGYSHDAANANGFLEPGMALMTKPFGMDAMASRIRSMMDSHIC